MTGPIAHRAINSSTAVFPDPASADHLTRLARLAARTLRAPIVLLGAEASDGSVRYATAVGVQAAEVDEGGGGRIRMPSSELLGDLTAPLVVPDVRESAWLQHDPVMCDLGIESCLAVPLTPVDEWVGALWIVDRTARQWTHEEVQTAMDLAMVVSLSIGNAWRFRAVTSAAHHRDEVQSMVAHDLQNPLNTVGMAVDLLRRLTADGVAPEMKRYIDVVGRSVGHMQRLIQDLLDVARLEARALSVNLANADPVALVAEMIELHRDVAASQSIQLLSSIPPDLPPVRVDAQRILQVFSNLLSNAMKFTPAGGSVWVRAEAGEGEVIFSVSDDGVGIPAEHQPHVFDRFWQASHAQRAGAGLGLAIARGIVTAHGGRIWVESEEGVGTTFRFTVPTA